MQGNLFISAALCLDCTDIAEKLALTDQVARAFADGTLDSASTTQPLPIGVPGRPARPMLVAPRQLPQRGLGSSEGRAALIHAVAHIELTPSIWPGTLSTGSAACHSTITETGSP